MLFLPRETERVECTLYGFILTKLILHINTYTIRQGRTYKIECDISIKVKIKM